MRPLRLLLDGFGCYRQRTEVDLSDVEFFALVGPTGAGKSTLIDGMCFALYGTVPRWRDKNEIKYALAPAANACRVCLVFEVAGTRYGIARALTRNSKGNVTTKAAQLDVLDPTVPASAPIGDLLEAIVEPLAEHERTVTAKVEEVLGLTYEHFIQSVLLPQGRFASFLQAEPSKRQDLLVELLAFSVYEQVGKLARQRANMAAAKQVAAERARAELADATPEAETAAAARIAELTRLADTVQQRLNALADLRQQAQDAAQEAQRVRDECTLLAALRTPAGVPDLARQIMDADRLVAERREQREATESAETAAQQARRPLGDKTELELFLKAYSDRQDLAARLEKQDQVRAAWTAELKQAEAEVEDADDTLRQAREARALAERAYAAAALAEGLRIGEDCPVCLRPVTDLPHHPAVTDLGEAGAAINAAEKRLDQARTAHRKAVRLELDAAGAVKAIHGQLDDLAAALADAPSETDVTASLKAIAKADEVLGQARQAVQAAREQLAEAERERAALSNAEKKAWAALARNRDAVVALGAPEMSSADLAADWDALSEWARRELEERRARQQGLDTAAADTLAEVDNAGLALTSLLAERGIDEVADPARAATDVATHLERARGRLATIQEKLERAAKLDAEIAAHREEEQVASTLGNLLKANTFEGWLCREALDSLVVEASGTLMALTGDQYELDLDERNNLFVIDHQDADAVRRVDTLSGGETFQASLALALALSKKVVGLSAGQREMNSMFLDEGFGTLDEDTLETVGTTLEALAADSDRMIGIITHVPALAERAPVRFVVSKTGTGSALRKEREPA
jgi:exonuclease SbcC